MKDECGQIRALEDIAKSLRNSSTLYHIEQSWRALAAGRTERAISELDEAISTERSAEKRRWQQIWRLLAVCADIRSRGFDVRQRRRLVRTLRSKHFFSSFGNWPSDELISVMINGGDDEDVVD